MLSPSACSRSCSDSEGVVEDGHCNRSAHVTGVICDEDGAYVESIAIIQLDFVNHPAHIVCLALFTFSQRASPVRPLCFGAYDRSTSLLLHLLRSSLLPVLQRLLATLKVVPGFSLLPVLQRLLAAPPPSVHLCAEGGILPLLDYDLGFLLQFVHILHNVRVHIYTLFHLVRPQCSLRGLHVFAHSVIVVRAEPKLRATATTDLNTGLRGANNLLLRVVGDL